MHNFKEILLDCPKLKTLPKKIYYWGYPKLGFYYDRKHLDKCDPLWKLMHD